MYVNAWPNIKTYFRGTFLYRFSGIFYVNCYFYPNKNNNVEHPEFPVCLINSVEMVLNQNFEASTYLSSYIA